MTTARIIFGDIARALSVLGLLLFAITSVPAAAAPVGASPAVAAAIADASVGQLCGGGWGDPAAHFACHACRSAAPALPPAPCTAEPVVFIVQPVAYAPVVATVPAPPPFRQPLLRGPPAA